MNYEKLDEVAIRLEEKYIPLSAMENQEAKEILALTQFYRIAKFKLTNGILSKAIDYLNENERGLDLYELDGLLKSLSISYECDDNGKWIFKSA